MSEEPQFKHTSRPVTHWPPTIPRYEHLLSVVSQGVETAHYCRIEDAAEVVELLIPNIELVERLLESGVSLECVVEDLRVPKP